jgi:hypothetical protein
LEGVPIDRRITLTLHCMKLKKKVKKISPDNINKNTFPVSSLVLNLLASQIGAFFLPHPVLSNVPK